MSIIRMRQSFVVDYFIANAMHELMCRANTDSHCVESAILMNMFSVWINNRRSTKNNQLSLKNSLEQNDQMQMMRIKCSLFVNKTLIRYLVHHIILWHRCIDEQFPGIETPTNEASSTPAVVCFSPSFWCSFCFQFGWNFPVLTQLTTIIFISLLLSKFNFFFRVYVSLFVVWLANVASCSQCDSVWMQTWCTWFSCQ